VSVSTSVTVIPVPRPTIVITPSPQQTTVNGTITFNVQVTVPQGIGILQTTINFCTSCPLPDGEFRSLGGASSAVVQKQYTTVGTKPVLVRVVDTTNQITEGTAVVTIVP
jgi:hypothetical protein